MVNLIHCIFQTSMVILGNILVFSSSNLTFSYIKTKVIQEKSNCKYPFSAFLKNLQCESLWDCAIICSSNPQCGRFMFDDISKQCFLKKFGQNCLTFGKTSNKECYIQKSVCDSNNCSKCAIGYYGNQCQHVVKDCHHNWKNGIQYPTLSFIRPNENGPVMEVRCHKGRTYIHCRRQSCNEVNFNRTWNEYVHGFGNVYSEYWLGLENIYHLVKDSVAYLRVEFTIGYNKAQNVHYKKFRIAPFSGDYGIFMVLRYESLRGNENDIFLNPNCSVYGVSFSTYDRDSTGFNCPRRFGGGWWYTDDSTCSCTNLNGRRTAANDEARMDWLNHDGYENQLTSFAISIVTYK